MNLKIVIKHCGCIGVYTVLQSSKRTNWRCWTTVIVLQNPFANCSSRSNQTELHLTLKYDCTFMFIGHKLSWMWNWLNKINDQFKTIEDNKEHWGIPKTILDWFFLYVGTSFLFVDPKIKYTRIHRHSRCSNKQKNIYAEATIVMLITKIVIVSVN